MSKQVSKLYMYHTLFSLGRTLCACTVVGTNSDGSVRLDINGVEEIVPKEKLRTHLYTPEAQCCSASEKQCINKVSNRVFVQSNMILSRAAVVSNSPESSLLEYGHIPSPV